MNLLTVGMLVRNEKFRYLDRVLTQLNTIADRVVIVDDASTDGTPEYISDTIQVPLSLYVNSEHQFGNEIIVRKQLWEKTISVESQWYLFLDADELFNENHLELIRPFLPNIKHGCMGVRFFDMWSETHYRYDPLWHPNDFHSAFFVRHYPDFPYKWMERAHHTGRIPFNAVDMGIFNSEIQVKHMGWAKQEDRIVKYHRYMEYDPKGEYGSLAQYQSILDPHPNLIPYIG